MNMIGAFDKQLNPNACIGYNTCTSDTAEIETLLRIYNGYTNPDPVKAESELTNSMPVSRKRSRDFSSGCTFSNEQHSNRMFTFLGDDVSSQIQQQEFEIDQYISLHTEKVRTEMEYRRRRNSMRLISALEEDITQRLRAKEDGIMKMTKLNYALEDKVKSLCIENQIWRELAQTNEATANALRNNLKQVLEHVVHNENDAVVADDAQSCYESNNGNECTLVEHDSRKSDMMNNRMCKRCGEVESSVLLLPCRHLCVCTVCVSSVDICPVCKSAKKISVHVYMS